MCDGTAEQSARPVHRLQAGHGGRSGGLSGHGDVVDGAAERGDVVPHPLQGGDLVEQAPVVRAGLPATDGRDVPEPLEAETVVERDHDESVSGKGRAVEVGLRGGAEDVGSAVDPDEHRERVAGAARGPDVEAEDVLVAG